MAEFKIYDVNIEALEAKLAKLNKKAVKLNCEPFALNILSTETIRNEELKTVNKVYTLELIGNPPKMDNWQFIGSIEPHDSMNLIKVIKGETYPENYRTHGNYCEHCKSTRSRKMLYLVRNTESGEFKAVGKTCLKDFTGHTNPLAYVTLLEAYLDSSWLEEFEGVPDGSGLQRKYILEEYLSYVSACIRDSGWTSRSKAQEEYCQATADYAVDIMTASEGRRKKYGYPEISDQDRELAQKSIAWAKELEATNDYLSNIKIIALDEVTTYKNMGFAASIVSSFTRHIEKEIEKEMKATSAKQELISGYVGSIGEKIQKELTFINSYSFETQWGDSHIYKFLDSEGNIFIWKSSKYLEKVVSVYIEEDENKTEYKHFEPIRQGEKVKIKGTIKDHSEYAGAKQTILTRCKIA